MAASTRIFLVIDDNVDNRFLLTRTLQRKYSQARVAECGTLAEAVDVLRTSEVDAVVSHRAGEIDGLELVRELRATHPTVPIVMVSGYDRTRAAFAAGATRFLNYDEWLRLGTVIDEIFATQPWAPLMGALAFAIRAHTIVTFETSDEAGRVSRHVVEPHVLGTTPDGRFALRAHAASRVASRGDDYGWGMYLLEQMQNVALTEQPFFPHSDELTPGRQFARVLCQA